MNIHALGNLNRFREIIAVLVKYGFNSIAHRLQFPTARFFGKLKSADAGPNSCERLRHVFEELGPTFVKLGQLLSLRVDLFPPQFIDEFRKLQDQVVPVPFKTIKEAIEKEFNRPLAQTFADFAEQPIAAGSLAQVHKAVLLESGALVAVKIRRPAISLNIATDMQMLETIAPFLEKHLDLAKSYNLTKVVKELKRAVLHEMDFQREAHHMKIVSQNLANAPFIHIPALHEPFCTETILTMELVTGAKLSEVAAILPAQRTKHAKQVLLIILKQILEDGFFHADPHPGNFLLLPDNRLSLLDWGIVGLLNSTLRGDLAEFVEAAAFQDSERVVEMLLKIIGSKPESLNRNELHRDILETLQRYHSIPLGKLNMLHLFTDLNSILSIHHLKIPADLALMFKALISVEGTARMLDPELNVAEQIKPYVHKVLIGRWQPGELWQKLRKTLFQLSILNRDLPLRLHHLLEKVETGRFAISLRHQDSHEFRETVDHGANRLSVSIIISALIIGSSMIVSTGLKPLLFGYPAIAVGGYLISALLGAGLLFAGRPGKK